MRGHNTQWRHEQWVYMAARLGIPITPSHRHIALASACTDAAQAPPEGPTVTVVGGQYFGAVDQALAMQARCLADAAGVDLLAVRFSGTEPGARFVSANPRPDITPDGVADAILEYLNEGSRRG